MRLLNAKTLELTEFMRDIPPYAILSHTWGPEEVTFQEIDSPERDKKKGFDKILGCCRQAVKDSLEWVWIDTCCIDKSSSAELSEAINSMFKWYYDSQICYAHLEDVTWPHPATGFPEEQFRSARWFTRGWCLQELIAPQAVEFYTADWIDIGTKLSLSRMIKSITAIPELVLLHRVLHHCSLAQIMSWASARQTTRVEDQAYCLLGLFGVNMPMLYGEGKRAFRRLQEEIIRQREDYSLLLWSKVPVRMHRQLPITRFPIFASEPECFDPNGPSVSDGQNLSYSGITRYPGQFRLSAARTARQLSQLPTAGWHWNPPQLTNRGLRVSLPGMELSDEEEPGEGVRYLLWSGYTYRTNLVCVVLEEHFMVEWESYLRSSDGTSPLLRLLPREMTGKLTTKEIYLDTERAEMVTLPGAVHWSEAAVALNVLLASSQKTTITLGQSYPALCFRKTMGGNSQGTTDGTEVWRADRWLTNDPLVLAEYDTLDLVIAVQAISANAFTGRRQTVQIDLTLGQVPLCGVREAGHDGMSPNYPESDRATYKFQNGELVTAGLKQITRGPLHLFILQVTVLPDTRE